jgi:hypothetical protein
MAGRDRTVTPAKGHRAKPPTGQPHVPMRKAVESKPAEGTEKPQVPCPEGTEELIPWLREQFPEVSPRTSDPRVVDACIARAACVDLINHIESSLLAGRKEAE